MLSNTILDSDEKDCLQELMNISYGVATAAITQIVNKFATLNIPKIEIVNSIEFSVSYSILSFCFEAVIL